MGRAQTPPGPAAQNPVWMRFGRAPARFSRHVKGGPGSALGDWQKAEVSVVAEASKAGAAQPDAPKAEVLPADAIKTDNPEADGTDCGTAKDVQIPADTETIQEVLTRLHSSVEHRLTQQ